MNLRRVIKLIKNDINIFLFFGAIGRGYEEERKKLDASVSQVGFDLRQRRFCWNGSCYLYRLLDIIVLRNSIKIHGGVEDQVVEI